MDYNPFDSDDEDFGFVGKKFEERNDHLINDVEIGDDDDENNKNLQTNPFLEDTNCMGSEISANSSSKKNPFLYDDDDDDDDDNEDNNACILNNNPLAQNKRTRGRGIPANFTESDFVTQQKLIEACKNEFIHNDLKKVHGVNDKFIEETEITELLRNCNIYSCAKTQLCSKNTLRVPNVLHNVNLKRKVPLITDDEYFKFEAAPPIIEDEIFEKEYLEAKYKYDDSTSTEAASSSSSSSFALSSSMTSTSSSEVKQPDEKIFTPKEVYMKKRNKKRGTPILSTSSNFKL